MHKAWIALAALILFSTPLFSSSKPEGTENMVVTLEDQLMIWIEQNAIEEVRDLIQKENPSLNVLSQEGETPLTLAASLGFKELTLLLLNNLADRNKVNVNGQTPLMLAIDNGHITTAEALILWDADTSLADNNGETALLKAVRQDELELAKKILAIDGEVSGQDNQGNSPLHWAVKNENASMIEALMAENLPVDSENNQGESPLSLALDSGRDVLWETLLSSADVSQLQTDAGSLLHWAVEHNNIELSQFLLNREPSLLESENSQGQYPVDLAMEEHQSKDVMELARYLIEEGSPEPKLPDYYYFYEVVTRNRADIDFGGGATALHLAAEMNHMGILEFLLADYSPSLDRQDENGGTALLYAIREGHEAVISYLLDQGASVHIYDSNGFSPIHYAIRLENYQRLCEMLRSEGASFNHQDSLGNTPLHRVIQYNLGLSRVEYLLAKGGDPNVRNIQGNTALMEAILENQRDIIEVLQGQADLFGENQSGLSPILLVLAKDIETLEWFFTDENINARDYQGNSVLHLAAAFPEGELEQDKLRLLVRKGAQVLSRNAQGQTPLHLAVDRGYALSANLLVNLGSQMYLLDNRGFSPLVAAYERGETFTQDFLTQGESILDLADNQGDTPLFHAIREGYNNLASALINWGADYNHSNLRGITPLLLVVEKGDLPLFHRLLEFGVDLNMGDKNGDRALHYLVKNQNFNQALAEALLDNGLEINQVNNQSMTALHYCSLYKNWEAMTYLVPLGAQVDLTDNRGFTPLFYSVLENDIRAYNYLVGRGANIRIRDLQGNTLLHGAIIEGLEDQNQALIRQIIEDGGDIYGVNSRGDSPLKIALTLGPLMLERLLYSRSINLQDNRGNTPMHLVLEWSDNPSIWAILIEQGADLSLRNGQGKTPYEWGLEQGYSQEELSSLNPHR